MLYGTLERDVSVGRGYSLPYPLKGLLTFFSVPVQKLEASKAIALPWQANDGAALDSKVAQQ